MSILNDTFTLYNGVEIPKIALGTWQTPSGEVCYNSVLCALKNGYRHIDTAYVYGNEQSVGKAIADCGIERSEIFVTTKCPAEIKTYEGAKEHFEKSLELLGLDYVDLYLIHAPWPWNDIGKDCKEGNVEVWKFFEEIYKNKKVRSIGVSNFNPDDLSYLMAHTQIKPMVNQIRCFIGDLQEETVEFCKQRDILVEAYSPLATGRLMKNKKILEMAEKYSATLPQICIRHALQKGILPLPKSTHEQYIISNSKVDFEISDVDMKYLDNLKDTI